MLGLPDHVRGCLFDLDGVLTQTATVHAAQWKEMFDAYLRSRAQATRERFEPFDDAAYDRSVNGRRRPDRVSSFPRSAARLRRPVVSSSTNCRDVLRAASVEELFEARIDGVGAERAHLKRKPAPDTFPARAPALGLSFAEAPVFENALAGVAAGRAGAFAHVVVEDLADLLDGR